MGKHTYQNTNVRRSNPAYTIAGSSMLWAWGYLCYLSPAMLPTGTTQSVGLEYGFFASGVASAALAILLVLFSRIQRMSIGNTVFFFCAMAISASSLCYAICPIDSISILSIPCGVVDGISVTLFGVAWGTRYSIEGSSSFRIAIVSFLVAFMLRLGIPLLPHTLAQIIVIILPLGSWALWKKDSTTRHDATHEPCCTHDKRSGEIVDGSWIARLLPWRSISIAIVLSAAVNLASSLYFGESYAEAEGAITGGVAVCALVSFLSIGFISPNRNSFSPEDCLRLVVTLCGIGFAMIAFSGREGSSISTALINGCSMFTQMLIIATVSIRTHEEGLSPLLAFGLAQGIISFVVALSSIVGKCLFALDPSNDAVRAIHTIAILALLIAMTHIAETNRPKNALESPLALTDSTQNTTQTKSAAHAIVANPEIADEGSAESLKEISNKYGLTMREFEVLGYLAKGRSYPRIAEELFITTGTVKTHARHIYEKLGVKTKQELIDFVEKSS